MHTTSTTTSSTTYVIMLPAIVSNVTYSILELICCVQHFLLLLRRAELHPIVSLDTKRDISSIAWSYHNEDDVAVAFTHRPEIHIYDLSSLLNDKDDEGATTAHSHPNAYAFHGGRDGCCKKVLNIMASKERSGHNVVIYWPTGSRTASNNTSTLKHLTSSRHNADDVASSSMMGEDHVVAGSSNGYIRYWNTNRCQSKDYSWSVIADPLRSPATASPVVSLLPLSGRGSGSLQRILLLSATSQGVVVLWDLSNMRSNSFGSTTLTPTSLIRMDYTTQLMLYEVPCRLIGVAASSSHHNPNHSSSCCSIKHSPTNTIDSQLIMTLSNGVIHLVDLSNAITTTSIIKNASIYSTYDDSHRSSSTLNPTGKSRVKGPNEPWVLSYEEIQHRQAVASAMQPQLTVSDLSCPAVIASWSGGTPIVSITRAEKSYLDVYDMMIDGDDIVHNSFPHMFTMNGKQPISGKVIDAQTGIMRSNMRRCENMSCTLPGHLMTAHPGSCEVVVSHDLQSYLTIESAAQSTVSKSHEIQFDWTPMDPLLSSISSSSKNRPSSIHTIDHRGVSTTNTTSSSIFAVSLIGYNSTSYSTTRGGVAGGHRIVLDSPYTGPIVHQGHPRVRLRTNLIPSGRNSNANVIVDSNSRRTNTSSDGARLTVATTATDGWPVVRRDMTGDLPAGDQVTALAAHPHCPVLIAGLRSEGVIVICPYHNASVEEEVEQVMEEVRSNAVAAIASVVSSSSSRPSTSHGMSGHPIISDMVEVVERINQSSSASSISGASSSSSISGASSTSKRTADSSSHHHYEGELSKKQRQSHIDFIPTQLLQMETKTEPTATIHHASEHQHHHHHHHNLDRGRQDLASLETDVSSSGHAIDVRGHSSGPPSIHRHGSNGATSTARSSISTASYGASLSYSRYSCLEMKPPQNTPLPRAVVTSISNKALSSSSNVGTTIYAPPLRSRSSIGPPSSSSSSFTVHTVTATGVARSNLEKKLLSKSLLSSSSSVASSDLSWPSSGNKHLQSLITSTTTSYLNRVTDRSISCGSSSSSSSRRSSRVDKDKENVPTIAQPIHGIPQELKGGTVKKPMKPTSITSFFGTTTTTTSK